MEKLMALEVSTAMGCKLNCVYCPQNLLIERYYENNKNRARFLTLDGFKQAISNVKKGGVISFAGMVEPFHNPYCADMIVYAYEQGYRIHLFTTLMGMHRNDFEKIKNIKINFFELHIPDKEENSHFVLNEEYYELLDLTQNQFHTYTYSCHGHVHPAVENHIDKTKFAGLILSDRAGNLDIGKKKIYRKAPFICSCGFESSISPWQPVMLPDGTLVACCSDYGMRHQFGNLLNETWEEITKKAPYKEFRKSWEDQSVASLCNSCGAATPIDELPAIALKKYLNGNKDKTGCLDAVEKSIFEKLKTAGRIVIWGAGSYFQDHYQYFKWNEALNPVAILDSNEDLWGQAVEGTFFLDPKTFVFEKDDLVIVFIKQKNVICDILEKKGINYVFIDEVFCLANDLNDNNP